MFRKNSLRFYMATTAVCSLMLCACKDTPQVAEPKADKADSLLFAVGSMRDYDRLRTLADSFEIAGDITALDANRWRGVSYYRQGQYRMAEICYRKAINCDVKDAKDQMNYNKVARRLSEILVVKGDYEDALKIAIPAITKMDQTGIGSDIDYAILLNNIGCCQLHLNREEEASESFMKAREHYANRWQTDSTARGFQEAVVGTVYTSAVYINTRHYADAIYWIDRSEMLLDMYRQKEDARSEYFDEYQGRIDIMRAIAMQGLGKYSEAKQAYNAFLRTNYSKSGPGKINANDYLLAAKRYQEAADNYQYLDQTMKEWDMEQSLENIQLYMLPKIKANNLAGRKDSAYIFGAQLISILDSAINEQKNSTAAELATIYDSNQKDARISQQQMELAQTKWTFTLAAMGLLLIFFAIYTLNRRKAQRRLTTAYEKLAEINEQLTIANAKAEESSKMKTNFIQQISHEIRTPLNILSGFTQVITTPGMQLDDDTRHDINEQMVDNTNRITSLVNKMLELSDASCKASIEKNDDILAVQIAAQAMENSGVSSLPNVQTNLIISPDCENVMLHTNEQQLTRALELLLDNAAKFLDKRDSKESREHHITLSVTKTNAPFINFTIEDDGIGIPPQEKEHIFEEFVQLDTYSPGTGIGLTVARSIARRLGGDITLDTTYQHGARFVLNAEV